MRLPLLLALASAPAGPAVADSAPSRPHVLVFICDDLSARDLVPYGARDVRTPRIASFAREALVFDRAFIVSPACAPSRAALLTGLNPARSGAIANHQNKRDEVASLPPLLAALGYQTAAFGKVAHGPRDAPRHGFSHIPESGRFQVADIADWLAARDRGKPVVLFAGTPAPHVPWPKNDGYDPAALTVPRNHYDTPEYRADRARYYTDVTQADSDFGAVLDLVHRELGPETVVIFTSDHGAQMPFGKWNLYDEGIRVPLLIAWPGRVRPGRTAAMVNWTDLLPTLLEALGGLVPDGLDGRSFARVLGNPAAAHRDRIFTTHNNDGRANVYPIRSVRTNRWKYIRNLQPGWIHSNHSDRFRKEGTARFFESWEMAAETDPRAAFVLTRYRQRAAEELYDLATDPDELNNLAADARHAATLVQLRTELDAWMAGQGDDGTVRVEPWLPGQPGLVVPGGGAAP